MNPETIFTDGSYSRENLAALRCVAAGVPMTRAGDVVERKGAEWVLDASHAEIARVFQKMVAHYEAVRAAGQRDAEERARRGGM